MPDYLALQAELAKPDLATLSDSAAATKLNTDVVELDPVPVPVADVESMTFRRGVMANLYAGVESTSPQARAACQTALALFHGRLTEVNMSDLAVSTLLDGLIGAGVMTAEDRDALVALADRSTTRAEAIPGWGLPVSEFDVAHARSL